MTTLEPSRVLNESPQRLAVLGATGSIGTQTLDVVRLFPDRFDVRALTCGANVDLLTEQAREFRPEVVVAGSAPKAKTLRHRLSSLDIEVLAGKEGLRHVAARDDVDSVVAAVVGFAGLVPVLAALRAGKRVALANKETMVVGGDLVQEAVEEGDGELLPVDSEHSAIFQCIAGESERTVETVVLTASGGPFRDRKSVV